VTTTSERIIRRLGIFTATGFLIVAETPVSNIAGQRLAVGEAVKASDAIVVLAAGLIHTGILHEESMRRTVHGIELYKQGLAPSLVVLGPARPHEPNPTEAEVRSKLARSMGIPPDAILKVETARTTRDESIQTGKLLQQRNVRRIILVTESLHMRRAKLAFERAGFEVLPAVSCHYPAAMLLPEERLWLAMRVLQESAALIYYRLAGYI
jgi:uncharacterized SAM-binding protein YcdF (DUF218 family)